MKKWAAVPLNQVAVDRGLIGGPFGSSLIASDYVPEGIPVIRGTNLVHGREVGGDFVFVSLDKFKRDLARNAASPGDLIFTQRGTLGQVALVPERGPSEYVISQSQMRLRVDPELASPLFVYYACSSPAFVRQVRDNAISTGVPHINLGILSRLEVPLPPIEEQRAIAAVLGALDDKISANAAAIATASSLAIALLADRAPTVPLRDLVEHRRQTVKPEGFVARNVAHYSLPAFDDGQRPDRADPVDIMSNKFQIERSSVLVSKLNPRFPRVWNVLSPAGELALASTEFLVLEPQGLSSSVLWAAVSQPSFSAALTAKAAGTSGSHQRVRPNDLLATLVIDPREVTPGIHSKIDSLGGLVENLRLESAVLLAVRSATLPALMSGQLQVQDTAGQSGEWRR